MAEATITPEEYEAWIPISNAYSDVSNHVNDLGVAIETILRRLINGSLRAACELFILHQDGQEQRLEYVTIAANVWRLSRVDWQNPLWSSGDVELFLDGQGSGMVIAANHDRVEIMGVRFDPVGVAKMLPKKVAATPITAIQASPQPQKAERRGAPRKGWWDDLWIEMIRRIMARTLKPKNIAEMQQILEAHVDEMGENYGDSTLKPMASKLFKYLKESGGKLAD